VEAVARVEIVKEGQTRYGTAFCVDTSGLFVTSADVVRAGMESGAVNLVLNPGGKGPQRARARVVRWNDVLGLGVLRIDPVRPLTALELGNDDAIRETLPVTAYGFPRADGVREDAPKPGATGNAVRVTALRRAGDRLVQVQVDGQLDAGYSGSPLVDPAGKVVGVVQSGLVTARINFAIPVGRISEYLSTPLISFDPPPVEAADRSKAIDWTIRVVPPKEGLRLPSGLAVSVTLPGGAETPHRVAARAAGAGIYTAKVVPMAGAPERLITLVVESSTGPVLGITPDLPLRIDGKAITLGDLETLRLSRPPRAFLRDGTALTGEILGLGRVEILTEAGPVAIDLRRARLVDVLRVGGAPHIGSIEVRIEVRSGTTVLCTETRRVDVRRIDGGLGPAKGGDGMGNLANSRGIRNEDGFVEVSGVLLAPSVGRGTALAIHRPSVAIPEASVRAGMGGESPDGMPSSQPLAARLDGSTAATPNGTGKAGPPLIRMLPGKVSAVISAGAGRYLLLTMPDSRRLAIFDASTADVTKIIPLPYEKVLVAGGSEKFVLVFPEQNVIERWDLSTLTREESRKSPIRARIVSIAMGSNASGPILAEWLVDEHTGRYSFIDARSLKVLKVPELARNRRTNLDTLSPGSAVIGLSGPGGHPPSFSIRASDDGRIFIVRPEDWTQPSQRCPLFELADGAVRVRYFGEPRDDPGPRLAGSDGRLLYAAYSVLDPEGNDVFPSRTGRRDSVVFLPSSDPGYFLGIAGLRISRHRESNPIHSPLSLTVFAAGSLIPLVTVHGMDEMDQLNPFNVYWNRPGPAFEQRFHWLPSAELLVTAPPSNDRLCLRRLAMPGALAGLGDHFLYVTSASILRATSGKKLSHRIELKSRKGGIKLTLIKGPEGLTLKPDALIEWNVPNRGGSFDETAVITIEDESGQSLFHRLKIQVR
jgi:hypothetical protein